VDYDGGGFVVSSREVGVAIQNFLHYATLSDVHTLHGHLLHEYAERYKEMMGDNIIDMTVRMPEREEREMRKRGHDDGWDAASWMVDGNTPEPFMFVSRILTGMEEGDPEIMDSLPMPRIGGEFADDPTWEQICQDVVGHYGLDGEQDLLGVYEEGFHEGVEAQLRKMYNDLSPSKKV
jgi:hypothetical protein